MKLSKPNYEFLQKIRTFFDPPKHDHDNSATIHKPKPKETKEVKKMEGINYDKWENVGSSSDEEKKEEQKKKEDAMHFGCARDHQKEIEIFEKPNSEKIKAINAFKEKGNESFREKEYDKASYYYAQALLQFYYLFSENEKEEAEINETKRRCHLNQAICFNKLGRFEEAVQECNQAIQILPSDIKGLYRRAENYLKLQKLEKAKADLESALRIEANNKEARDLYNRVVKEMRNYEDQQKQLFKTMLTGSKD